MIVLDLKKYLDPFFWIFFKKLLFSKNTNKIFTIFNILLVHKKVVIALNGTLARVLDKNLRNPIFY